MNYYGKLYHDGNDIHITIIEGIYESHLRQKARVLGDINISNSTFCKYVKQPYDVIHIGDTTVTLKKYNFNIETNSILYEEIYTLLSQLLTSNGYTQVRIDQITSAIDTISNNRSIKTNQGCVGDWITL
jgi:hypothetical protein